ncbi:MAG: radical SAM protein [Bacteroidota bacterium]
MKQTLPLTENEVGVLNGGFSNFPKSRNIEKEPIQSADFIDSSLLKKYKASRFNSFIPFEGQIIGFNAYTQQFLTLDAMLLDLFNAAILEDNITGLADIHPELFLEFIRHGYVVEHDVDETQKVKDLRNEVDLSNKKYELTINPTMNCNFKCWYCYESHIKGSKMDPETITKIQKHIDKVLAENPDLEEFHISWFGGEPMLYFDNVVKPIITYGHEAMKDRETELTSGFTTNGYLIKPEMIPFFKKYNIDNFQITLDGHRDKHNTVRYTASTKGTYDKIIENIKLLTRHEIPVYVRINYTEETLEKVEHVVDDFAELNEKERAFMMFSFHNVWQDRKPSRERLEKVITRFRSNDFITNSLFSSVDTLRHSCYADKKNHATINYNGEVFKCTARDFTTDSREGDMTAEGDIVWNEKFDERMNAKFNNSPCLSCRIQPICNGGCSQQAMENAGEDYCVIEMSGISKDDVILSKFKQKLEHQILRRAKLVRRINAGIF